jgi:hypothetical protein
LGRYLVTITRVVFVGRMSTVCAAPVSAVSTPDSTTSLAGVQSPTKRLDNNSARMANAKILRSCATPMIGCLSPMAHLTAFGA